ncbi:MAG: type II toxin-antitoxin system VapC family toxin [Bryobacteraceae bacterium]|jgi:predicted nucleic acid-binding protein
MAFVLDAPITASWAFDDEDHPDARLAFDRMRTEEAVVPCLWWFEVRNIVIVNERRRRITESGTGSFLLNLSLLQLRVDRSPDENAVFRLARTHRLSVYDAVYLELAQRESLPLATLDADLRRAAAGEGVALVSNGNAEDPRSTRK